MFANFSLSGSKSLKDLIKAIRSCKTAADERSLIAKESSYIRSSFRESTNHSNKSRFKNVSKLLYIHMLGYPGGNWGQIECLKLMSSAKYFEKRLGYLGIMLLMDENMETLTLVTNSLKNDLNNPNIYIVALALSAFSNICSAEMAKDLHSEIGKHLTNINPYIRKKAALCVVRILRKVPELHETFIQRSKNLISNEKNNSVILTGITLIIELCNKNEKMIQEFRKMLPVFIKLLSNLLQSPANTEYDVNGVNDPFLQVQLLKLLRILAKGSLEASEKMNDILALIASSTDQSKMAGSSVLYETILTIVDIEADHALRVMAINILGSFLSNKDNNLRYVALNVLSKIILVDSESVQRHRDTILECLNDPDMSIRKRALELCFLIINEHNIQFMMKNLLKYFENGVDREFVSYMSTNLAASTEKFATDDKWYVDNLITIFKLAKFEVKEETLNHFLKYIASCSNDLQAYVTFSLYQNMADLSLNMEALIQATAWCIGEYGQHLTIPGTYEGIPFSSIPEKEILNQLELLLNRNLISIPCKYYLLTSLMKLSVRFESLSNAVKGIIKRFMSEYDVELQQRVLEYYRLFDDTTLRAIVFDRIPASEMDHNKKHLSIESSMQNSLTELLSELELKPTSPNLEATSPKLDPSHHHPLQKSSFPSELKEIGEYCVYQDNGLDLYLKRFIDASDPSLVTLKAIFKNNNQDYCTIEDLLFQAAVPKSMKLHMNPPSDNKIDHGGQVIQILKIINATQAPLKLRMKIHYKLDGGNILDMCDYAFPEAE